MAKKSNKSLFIIFGIVLALLVIYSILDSDEYEGTFRTKVVDVDTAEIDEIFITLRGGNEEAHLFKTGDRWNVDIGEYGTAYVKASKINEIFRTASGIEADVIVTRDETKWNEYNVDSTGIRVRMLAGGDVEADFVIGKFLVKQPKKVFTFIRDFNKSDIYRIEGVLTVPFDRQPDDFRNNTLINDNYQLWISAMFDTPGVSFKLRNSEQGWMLDGQPADNVAVFNYFAGLSNLNHDMFVDGYQDSVIVDPQYSLTITRPAKEPIIIEAKEVDSIMVIHSSENPSEFFAGTKELMLKIFQERGSFVQ